MMNTVSQMTFETGTNLQLRKGNCNKMNGSRSQELHLIADFLVLSKNDFFVAIDKANFLAVTPTTIGIGASFRRRMEQLIGS